MIGLTARCDWCGAICGAIGAPSEPLRHAEDCAPLPDYDGLLLHPPVTWERVDERD
jgi:hypothetical protein